MYDNNAIDLNDVTIKLGNRLIFEHLNLSIIKGETIGILGKSGSGKSTLLNAIAGFIPLNGGNILFDGSIGYCFQNNSLYPFMTVEENIAFGILDLPKKIRNEKVRSILTRIDLFAHKDKYPTELSGGQMQRVSLGRAIAYNPNLLLLDEPFSALDFLTRLSMINWVAGVLDQLETTTILVTHYIDEALLLCNRIFILSGNGLAQFENTYFRSEIHRSEIKYSEAFQAESAMLQQMLST
jgi:ABC-type nitrate/sulfonate/bicarbonate transport system ATPase subunit